MADESAEITLNSNSSNQIELVQPFKVESDSSTNNTNAATIEVKPLAQTSEQTIEVKPLAQTSDQTVELKPVKVDSRQEVALTDPIRTDSSSTLDVKPVALDVCLRTGQASLPPTHVCEPYQHKVAFTLMGIEVFGLAWSGESQTIVEDRPGRPVVAWGAVTSTPPAKHIGHGGDHPAPHAHDGGGGGLRIRLTD
jgi:hypothetical protein